MTERGDGRGGKFMIRMEPEAPGRAARVIGSLTGDAVQLLAEAVEGGVTMLDLSAVDQVDDAAVQVLSRLWPERCSLIACPRWLELWLETARRRAAASATDPPGHRHDRSRPARAHALTLSKTR